MKRPKIFAMLLRFACGGFPVKARGGAADTNFLMKVDDVAPDVRCRFSARGGELSG